jgi:hypothetical protein
MAEWIYEGVITDCLNSSCSKLYKILNEVVIGAGCKDSHSGISCLLHQKHNPFPLAKKEIAHSKW